MHDRHAARGTASARHRRFLPPIDARYRAAIAIILAAAPLLGVGCSDDGGDETFETPNEIDGSETEGTPAGDVDSTEGGG